MVGGQVTTKTLPVRAWIAPSPTVDNVAALLRADGVPFPSVQSSRATRLAEAWVAWRLLHGDAEALLSSPRIYSLGDSAGFALLGPPYWSPIPTARGGEPAAAEAARRLEQARCFLGGDRIPEELWRQWLERGEETTARVIFDRLEECGWTLVQTA